LTALARPCKFKSRLGKRLRHHSKRNYCIGNAWVRAVALIVAGTYAHAQTAPGRPAASPATENSRHTVSVDSRPQLFAVLCALDAAGLDSGAGAAGDTPGRVQLRKRMLALQGPAVDALRKYYAEHALADSGATFSRFSTFALVAGPPPDFQFELRRDDLPPEALTLEGFNTVLANFYREAKIDELWHFYQPDYERGVESLRAPVSNLVFVVANYLREIIRSSSPRSFSVYVDPLAGGKTIFRNIGDRYAMVVRPSSNPPMDDIRHAFLHFLLDPIAIRYRAQASKGAPLLQIAARAPLLPVALRDDYPAFFDECLVRAVELRLSHLTPAELGSAIDRDEAAGFVMVRPIYAGLSGFEKSDPAMSYYLPELIGGIDVGAEQRRLGGVRFAEAAPEEVAQAENIRAAAPKPNPPVSSDPLADALAEGQRQISARNGAAAAASFEQVLASSPDDLRATYGLAVASALQGKPDQARELFSKVIAASQNPLAGAAAQPDPSNLCWSHIYLGRMYDVEGKRDLAILEYRAALTVAGAPESARAAAQHGIEAGYQTPSRDKQDKQSDRKS
jgi:tetratricopeptide (TPR) repeat protein